MTVPPVKKNRKKAIVILAIVIIAAAILAVPPVLAGGFNVPLSKVSFGETEGSPLQATGSASANVSVVTAYEYYFLIRSRGTVQTTDSSVSSSSGTVVLLMDMQLTNPSGTTVDLGNTTITGGIGTRNHTVYLSVDQGVRVAGTYTLKIFLAARVTVGGLLEIGVVSNIMVPISFTVS